MLDVIFSWCRKWRLGITYLKFVVVSFCKRLQKISDHVFCIGGDCLDSTTSSKCKYLRVLFDEFATFKNNKENRWTCTRRTYFIFIFKQIDRVQHIGKYVSKRSVVNSILLQRSVGIYKILQHWICTATVTALRFVFGSVPVYSDFSCSWR